MEKWLSIKEYPKYSVSDKGNVKNVETGRILRHGTNPKGYHIVTLYKDAIPTTKKVHRLVADAFHNGDHSNLEVNHIDGNKDNNSIANLEWCTCSYNANHAYKTGLRKPPRMKKVKIVETGDIFNSLSDCARAIGGSVSGIYDCSTGRQETHRGYHFEFV